MFAEICRKTIENGVTLMKWDRDAIVMPRVLKTEEKKGQSMRDVNKIGSTSIGMLMLPINKIVMNGLK